MPWYVSCKTPVPDACLYSSADKSPVWFCHIPYLVVGFPGSIHCHLLFFFFFFLIAPLLLIVRMHACIWLKSRSDLMNRLQTNLHVASGARLAYFSPSLCSRKIDVFVRARARSAAKGRCWSHVTCWRSRTLKETKKPLSLLKSSPILFCRLSRLLGCHRYQPRDDRLQLQLYFPHNSALFVVLPL